MNHGVEEQYSPENDRRIRFGEVHPIELRYGYQLRGRASSEETATPADYPDPRNRRTSKHLTPALS
jgi:hypothetical protein